MMSPTPSCTSRTQARSAERYSTSTVDRTRAGGSVKKITRRSLLVSAAASIVGMLLAENSLSASFASPTQIDAGLWWPPAIRSSLLSSFAMSVECTRCQCLKAPGTLRASPVCAGNSVPTAGNATTTIDCQNSRVPLRVLLASVVASLSALDRRPLRVLKPRLEDGDVLLDGSSADADTGDPLAPSAERRSAAHRAVAAASEPHQREEILAGLHERQQVGGSHPHQGRGVGLPLGDLEREGRRAAHAVREDHIAMRVDDANGDRHNGARRGRLDAVGDRLCESE